MADLNEVRLIGRLTRDPELRTTPTGMAVSTLGLATNRKFKGQDGVLREETTFVDITCWSKTAEMAAKYGKKGRLIFIAGRLKFDSWDDKQTNQKRSKLSVVAENVQFLDRREEPGNVTEISATVEENPPEWSAPMPDRPAAASNGIKPNPLTPPVQPKPSTTTSDGWEPPDVGEPPF